MKIPIRLVHNHADHPAALIDRALRAHDGACIWSLASSAARADVFFDTLRDCTFHVGHHDIGESNSANANPSVAKYSSMLMWPVALDRRLLSGSGGVREALSTDSAQQLAAQIGKLTDATSTVCLIHPLFGYNMVSWADPVVMRQLFEQTAQSRREIEVPSGESEQISLQRFPYGVPEDAPVLYFLIGAVTHEGEWPQLLSPADVRTQDANSLLESMLQLELAQSAQEMAFPLHVAAPALGSHAIESGLMLWLTLLSRQYRFSHWDVLHQGDDRVDLLIELDNGAISPIQIPLRQYQMGTAGVERVMEHLEALVKVATSKLDEAVSSSDDCH